VVALSEAYAACERIARAHAENFPVASLLLPRHMRRHVAAVYAFARVADDFADEGSHEAAVRCRLLDGWQARLRAAVEGRPGAPPQRGEPAEAVEIFEAVGATIRERSLPVTLFEDLLDAFRQDVHVHQYETWHQLLDYCRRSANPVGQLVLRIAGRADPRLDEQSDALCTALQLTNFWQDVAIDAARGRRYLPAEEFERAGVSATASLLVPGAEWRQPLQAAARRTRALFDAGRPLCDAVRGRLRYELRATWLGGVRILDQLERRGGDPLAARPRLGAADTPWLVWNMVSWR
jgi:squalene synthase HpnC